MDAQRKKPGRAAKGAPALLVRTGDDSDSMHELSGAATLVAISPVDEEVTSPTAAAAADSVECRRSSRKKIPKFDVRDLLLKQHRKPHKIQIEARIDSNAPSTSRMTNIDGTAATNVRSLEKCFIEKTSIIQRTPAAALVPIPVTTEIFKPSQTSSLIVAQMESSSPSQRQQKVLKNVPKTVKSPSPPAITTPTLNATVLTASIESDANAPKRRGRPPKNRSLVERFMEKRTVETADLSAMESFKSDVRVSKDLIPIAETEIGANTDAVEKIKETMAEISENYVTKEKVSCSKDATTSDKLLGKVCDTKPTEEIVSDVLEKNLAITITDGFTKEHRKLPEAENLVDVLEKSGEESLRAGKQTLQNAFEFSCQEKHESQADYQQEFKEENSQKPTSTSIEIVSTSKFSDKTKELLAVKSETSTELQLEENIPVIGSPTFASKDLEQLKSISSPPRKTSTPTQTPRRCERRSGRRLDDASNNKTLEETFAEIAAKSCKAILDMATQKSNETNSDTIKEQSLQLAELTTEVNRSVELAMEAQESAKIQTINAEHNSTAELCDVAVPSIKKRGRKPKSKILEGDGSFSEEGSLEQNELLGEEDVCIENIAEKKISNSQKQQETNIENLTSTVELSSAERINATGKPSTITSKEAKDHSLIVTPTTSAEIAKEVSENVVNMKSEIKNVLSTPTVHGEASDLERKHKDLATKSKDTILLIDDSKAELTTNEYKTKTYRRPYSNEKTQSSQSEKNEKKSESSKSVQQGKKEIFNIESSGDVELIDNLEKMYSDKNQQKYKTVACMSSKEKSKQEKSKDRVFLPKGHDSSTGSDIRNKLVKNDSKESLKIKSKDSHRRSQKETNINLDKSDAMKILIGPAETVANKTVTSSELKEEIFELASQSFASHKDGTIAPRRNEKTDAAKHPEVELDNITKVCNVESRIKTEESLTSEEPKHRAIEKIVEEHNEMSSKFSYQQKNEKYTFENINQRSSKLKESDLHPVVEKETLKKHEDTESAIEEQNSAEHVVDEKETSTKFKKNNNGKNDVENKETFEKLQPSTSKVFTNVKESSTSVVYTDPTKYDKETSKKMDKISDKKCEEDKEKYSKLKEKSFEKYIFDELDRSKKLKKYRSERSYKETKESHRKERKDKSADKSEFKKKEKSKLERSKETVSEKQVYKDYNIFDGLDTPEDRASKVRKEKLTKDGSEAFSAKDATKLDSKSLKKKHREQQTSASDLPTKEKNKAEMQKRKNKSNESDSPVGASTPMTSKKETQSPSPLESSKKADSSDSSHKKQKNRKDSEGKPGLKESDSIKESRKTETTSKSDTDSRKHKSKDKDKQVHKERQRKLQTALLAALETKTNPTPSKSEAVIDDSQPAAAQVTKEQSLAFADLQLPPTPGSDKYANLELIADLSMEIGSKSDATPDPFYDIAKFIEDGVNLLKRDYKLDENEAKILQQSGEGDNKLNEIAKTILPTASQNLNSKTIDLYETPADTPANTPGQTTPSSSPIPTDNTDNSLDTYYYSDGKRRSHRLKKITSAPKAQEGRGLAKLHYSLEDHLTDLAEVEAKNAQFLKDMEERLSNFQVIKESEYHCERLISREARKMVCDCFLTPEEAERGELGCGEDCLNRLLMIECGANCKVGERCTNNRFQKILCAPCRVFRTEKKGFGIMADVEIHPGEFIMEYVGEVLDSDEFEQRRIAYSKDKNRHYYFMELRRDAIIDATTKGNISRFINHSCDPNAETQKWTVNGELRIGFFTRKTIMPGEEITFDYQYQRYGREAQRCYCESANCRGWIGEEPDSDEGEQIDDDDDDEEDEDEEEEEEQTLDEILEQMDDEKVAAAESDITEGAALLKTKINLATSTEKPTELDASAESKQKFLASLGKISAKLDLNKQRKLEEKKLRKKRKRKQVAEKRRSTAPATSRFLEDPDLEDEIDFLSRCGLKNQSDTLRFSRLMVRAKLVPTRLNLLAILREGELPCRRLFLDYHGLHLLHGWMNEDGRTDMTMRLVLLQTLDCLPIANKTVLTDSRVYQGLRGWCSSEKQASLAAATTAADVAEANSSSSPSDESSKESGEQKNQKESSDSTPKSDEIEKLAAKLLSTWDKLPEIFRIPKRERIEQMKEHEREADRQYAATIEANESAQKTASSTDRYQRDRFERRFGKQYGIRSIGVFGGPGSNGGNGSGSLYKKSSSLLSSEDTKNLSKEQRRELFAARVAHEEAEKRLAERRREFDTKCNFFGLDPRATRPEDVPFCVSDSGQWFNERRQHISKPPAFAHVQVPIKPKSTNSADYDLPKAAKNLPPEWGFTITDQGKIYYYHLKHRIPQWEPPTVEQISQTKWSDSESESDYDEEEVGAEEITEERIKEIEAIQSQEELSAFLKKIAQEQRQSRYKRLVEERPISPRREEDRIYNQIEMRKYKENKEKIKKRKEEIRRRRSEAAKSSMPYMCTLGSLLDAAGKAGTSVEATKVTEHGEMPADALPIQDYLLSSDDDAAYEQDIDEMKAECNNSPLLEKIVQGDKIVDELDALTTKRQLKRPLPPHRDLSFDLNISASSGVAAAVAGSSATISNSSIDKIEYKKRRQEKKEKSKRSRDSGDTKYRKLKEKFRCEIAGIIVQHLKPYRKESCTFGRIRSNEDFNHLAKKLTHFVMVKELKYCDAVGQTLVVTESVKNKSREFIKKYMAKYESGYVKPANDPDFKDIPFTL